MQRYGSRLTVLYEEPFWIGVFEEVTENLLRVSKVTFGSEPKDCEINRFIQENYYRLQFSPCIVAAVKPESKNPKRKMREAHKQTQSNGIGTKSQQALKLQQEQQKTEQKSKSREQKEAEKERYFELKQKKRKEKHRGR